MAEKSPKTVYYRKQVPLFRLVQKIKLWPSRKGILHGVRSFEPRGGYGEIITHCDKRMVVRDSKKSRSARWLRNKWSVKTCPTCRIPAWKLEKYSTTFFRRRYGSQLVGHEPPPPTTR
jgi:pyrrolysyl-tRNA synthetase-like protein